MPTNTYVALDKITVGTATNSITFSSINQGYTDLIIVTDAGASVISEVDVRVGNSSVDTGSNYSRTVLSGDGSSATSVRNSSQTYWRPNYNSVYDNANGKSNHIFHFMNYSNTNVFKTMLYRGNSAAYGVDASVNLWRSTSAINVITLYANVAGTKNFLAGSTFSLYGIAATSVGAKATGGDIYTDSQYYYHVFDSTGTFTPLQSLTCDYLVVAGGGGGGNTFGGGGGAGGLRSTVGTTGGGGSLESALSVTAQNYTITVGAGGAGGTVGGNRQGTSGTASTFSTVSSTGGGGGAFDTTGQAGGSGGGGATGAAGTLTTLGGAGTANQGYAGGRSDGTRVSGGGGGGAGVIGSDALSGTNGGGAGGNGVTISGFATATGTGVNSLYAGGGGGGTISTYGTAGAGGSGGGGAGGRTGAGTNGVSNTGGGGGGGGYTNTEFNGGNGGSGIVIIRYAK